jgi:hypothetical protein
VAVITTKKSQATTTLAWLRTKGQPALFRVRRAQWTISMEVLADGARGDLNGQQIDEAIQAIEHLAKLSNRKKRGRPPKVNSQSAQDETSGRVPLLMPQDATMNNGGR